MSAPQPPPFGSEPPGGGLGPPPGEGHEGPSASSSGAIPVLAHLLGLITGFVGPLVMYLALSDPEGRHHAAAALNWQISLLLYLIGVGVVLGGLGFALAGPLVFLLIPVVLGLFAYDLVICIVAAVKGGGNERFRYPGALPLVRPAG